ncbi:hypothetical protein HYDPIDRAFT_23736 [Hydnomerulius pinastri MD-312]|nr:hypothetical protein HYDPIDRAFT_23736 [Hydnomerulius pinastri MD-312]
MQSLSDIPNHYLAVQQENTSLLNEVGTLTQTVTNLNQWIEQMETEKQVVNMMYKKLLEKVIYSSSIDTPERLFLRKSHWKVFRNRNRGVLGIKIDSPFSFLVDSEGNPISAETLISWLKANTFTLTFFHHEMRTLDPEFHLCEYNWKANAFAIRVLPQWEGKPTKASDIIIKLEPGVKQELTTESTCSTSNPAVIATKRPPSLMMLNPAILLKKSRLNLENSRPTSAPVFTTIANKGKAVAVSAADRGKFQGIKISNPLAQRTTTTNSKENTAPRGISTNNVTSTSMTPVAATAINDNTSETSDGPPPLMPLAQLLATCAEVLNSPTTLQALTQSLAMPICQAANPTWMPTASIKPKLKKMNADTPAQSMAGVIGIAGKPKRKCAPANPNTSMHFMKKPNSR